MSYAKWLRGATDEVRSAISSLNNPDFMPNFEDSTVSESCTDTQSEWMAKVISWRKTLKSSRKTTESSVQPEFIPSCFDRDQNYGLDRERKMLTSVSRNHNANSDGDGNSDGAISTREARRSDHPSSSNSSCPLVIYIQDKMYRVENLVDVERTVATIAMYEAAAEGDLQMVESLLTSKSGVNINFPTGPQGTPLMVACYYGNVKVVQRLLDAGADVSIGDSYYGIGLNRNAPLDLATLSGNQVVVEMILTACTALEDKGVNYQSSRKRSIQNASFSGLIESLKALLDADAKASIKVMTDFYDPLEHAVISTQLDVIKPLLSAHKGSQANYDYGRSKKLCVGKALHCAVYGVNKAMVRLLLDNSADIHFRAGSDNLTVLQVAIRANLQGDLINLLVERGALKQAWESSDLDVTHLLIETGKVIDLSIPEMSDMPEMSLVERYPELVRARPGDQLDPEKQRLMNEWISANSAAGQAKSLTETNRQEGSRGSDAIDWTWIESPTPRDCGCMICRVEREEQLPSRSWPLSPFGIPTITDPVSVTLGHMGKLDFPPTPAQMEVKLYGAPMPKRTAELEEVQVKQISSDETLERLRQPRPESRVWDDDDPNS